MTIGEFIKKKREEKDLSIRKLASKAGISHVHLLNIETNDSRPSFEIVLRILSALNVPLNEFLAETNYLDKNVAPTELLETRLVPIISWVKAGEWNFASDPFPVGYAEDWILTEIKGDNVFALIVKGDSMEPEFREGEIIIVNPHVAPVPGDYVIVKNSESNEATFKQLKKYGDVLVLHPLNPKYPDIEIKDPSKYRIIGKVVEKKKRY